MGVNLKNRVNRLSDPSVENQLYRLNGKCGQKQHFAGLGVNVYSGKCTIHIHLSVKYRHDMIITKYFFLILNMDKY